MYCTRPQACVAPTLVDFVMGDLPVTVILCTLAVLYCTETDIGYLHWFKSHTPDQPGLQPKCNELFKSVVRYSKVFNPSVVRVFNPSVMGCSKV